MASKTYTYEKSLGHPDNSSMKASYTIEAKPKGDVATTISIPLSYTAPNFFFKDQLPEAKRHQEYLYLKIRSTLSACKVELGQGSTSEPRNSGMAAAYEPITYNNELIITLPQGTKPTQLADALAQAMNDEGFFPSADVRKAEAKDAEAKFREKNPRFIEAVETILQKKYPEAKDSTHVKTLENIVAAAVTHLAGLKR